MTVILILPPRPTHEVSIWLMDLDEKCRKFTEQSQLSTEYMYYRLYIQCFYVTYKVRADPDYLVLANLGKIP